MENYEKLIDDILDGNIDVPRSSGEGRIVYIFDDIVVKIPNPNNDIRKSGKEQSKTEWEVWNAEKSDYLCPVYGFYRDCIVMRRLETDKNKIIDLLGLSNEEELRLYVAKLSFSIMGYLFRNYKLNGDDLYKVNSWGYDHVDGKLKLLDYGLKASSYVSSMYK